MSWLFLSEIHIKKKKKKRDILCTISILRFSVGILLLEVLNLKEPRNYFEIIFPLFLKTILIEA